MKGIDRRLHSVFDHAADPHAVDALRRSIVEEVHHFRQSHAAITKITATELGPEVFRRLKEKFDPLLYFGTFNLPQKRDLVYELIWKTTEATGKYTGCQFWSVRAKALFDQHADWPISLKTAKAIEKTLSLKTRNKSDRLTHEHVYPIKDLKLLLSKIDPTPKEISQLFETHCLGCVVVEEEHDREAGTYENPWTRYKLAGIQIARNPAWTARQRDLLEQAGVLDPS
jgi:hypothetical protein